jgi:ribosome-associated translation inhibitor RaiA
MQQANLTEITLKLPQKFVDSLAKNEIMSFLLDKTFNKIEYYLSRCQEMEQKYGMPFRDFKNKVEKSKKEVFEEWDDLMEWEAYELAYKEWENKYQELKNCTVS